MVKRVLLAVVLFCVKELGKGYIKRETLLQ